MDVILAGAIRIELISLVLETKAQPLYQTPRQRINYIIKKIVCQLFLRPYGVKFYKNQKHFKKSSYDGEKNGNFIYGRRVFG